MTQRRQVKFLKVEAAGPPLGVHRIVIWRLPWLSRKVDVR